MTWDGGQREVLGIRLHSQIDPGLKTWEGSRAAREHHVSANQKTQWKDVGRGSRLSRIRQPTLSQVPSWKPVCVLCGGGLSNVSLQKGFCF